MTQSTEQLRTALRNARVSPVVPVDLNAEDVVIFDFTDANADIAELDIADMHSLTDYTDKVLADAGTQIGIGKYDEDRVLYAKSPLFAGAEPRSVHMAIDIWGPPGTPVHAPLAGIVHSFQDNNNFKDYGPTIILEHELEGMTFYTLYGHLSRSSLAGLSDGQAIAAGQQIATFGAIDENGTWPPHLHIQIITDMQGKRGDFPGVCRPSDREMFRELCPDPNLLLRIARLEDE